MKRLKYNLEKERKKERKKETKKERVGRVCLSSYNGKIAALADPFEFMA